MKRWNVKLLLLCCAMLVLGSSLNAQKPKQMKKNYECDIIKLHNGNNLAMFFFGHASFMFDYESRIIYVDPVSEYMDFSALPPADVILVTHEHFDHCDPEAIKKLKKEDTRIIVNKASKDILNDGYVLNYGDVWAYEDFSVEATQAYNTTPGREKFHPKGRDNGYFLHFDEFTVYISGDTEVVENAEEYKGCDLLFLAVNQPYTMTIEQAQHFVHLIQPKIFYPYHTTDTDIERLKSVMEKENCELRIRQMK